jgi:uncharacterized protein (TIGR02246 family)
VSFALPAFSQQKETVDLQIVEQLDGLTQKFMDVIDSNDAAAIARVYAEDAVLVSDTQGPIYGREAIQKFFADVFQKSRISVIILPRLIRIPLVF